MSGLLQRLAGQAMFSPFTAAPRVRPAVSVHAVVPMGLTQETDESRPTTAIASESRPAARGANTSTRAPRQLDVDRDSERQGKVAGTPAMRASASPAPCDPLARQRLPEFAEGAPRALLEAAQGGHPSPLIKPVAQAPIAVKLASDDARTEPTEVHVHIGRIEVIAAQEQSAPKRSRSAAARNTLPLADYLARRRS